MEIQQLFIDGRKFNASSNPTFSNFSPSTGEKLGEIQTASKADIEEAVYSSSQGFKKWSRMSATARARILMKASQIIRERVSELAHLEVLDTGKPISEALTVDVHSGADAIEYFAGLAPGIHGSHINLGNSYAITRREPLGICAGIGAWNYPFQIACWKSAPALACGNSMIFKTSPLTPLSAMKLAEIYTEAGVPAGVFNVIHGGRETGDLLVSHAGIRKVSLTGSVGTGKKVMARAAETLKHVSLELGGKSPLLIFSDCDLDHAVSAALAANFITQGEICSNGTRVFVEESMIQAFLDRLLPRVSKIRVGDPFAPETQMGALISPEHLEKVQKYIQSGNQEGARLLCGGKVPEWEDLKSTPSPLRGGNFILPTVFADCYDQMAIVKEEIFGPVMSILSFKTEEEAIERANSTPYGLAAGVMTHDLRRANRVANQLEAGICWINNYNITPVEIPFGGTKLSGMGRENGQAAIENYSQLKTIYTEMDQIQSPF